MNLDEQIRIILKNYDQFITTKEAINDIKQLINEAYRKGYNDNARDCYCDSPGATEGVLPHKHLMDDGESHDIRPDIITTKRGELNGTTDKS